MNINIEICNSFNNHAKEYEQAAKMQYEIGVRLFERLDYLKITPRYVLDLGSGPGVFSQKLKQYYPKAEIISLDIAYRMLKETKQKHSLFNKWPLVNASMTSMPFATGVFDLIFANQVLHWTDSFPVLMRELNRVMNVGGCLMFSTLGPDTFRELKQPLQTPIQHAHANEFMDMHDIGDCLLSECFLDPVVDMDILTALYASLSDLFKSLKKQGVKNIHRSRNQGLTGKSYWKYFEQSIATHRTSEGKIPLTYEVVYGHAWKGEQRRTGKGIETFVSIDQLRNGN